jgi:hypothetical protein
MGFGLAPDLQLRKIRSWEFANATQTMRSRFQYVLAITVMFASHSVSIATRKILTHTLEASWSISAVSIAGIVVSPQRAYTTFT